MEEIFITFEEVAERENLTFYQVKEKEFDERVYHILQTGQFYGQHAVKVLKRKKIRSVDDFLKLKDATDVIFIHENEKSDFETFRAYFEEEMLKVGKQLFSPDKMINKTVKFVNYSNERYPQITFSFTDNSFIIFESKYDLQLRESNMVVSDKKIYLSKINFSIKDITYWRHIGLISASFFDAYEQKYYDETNLKFRKKEERERKMLVKLKAKYESANK